MFICSWQYVPPLSGESRSVSVSQSSIAGPSPKMVLGGTTAYSSGVGSSPNGASDARRANARDLLVFAVFVSVSHGKMLLVAGPFAAATSFRVTLGTSRMSRYNVLAVAGDRATQECDPSTATAPYGMGLVFSVIPALYHHAGGFNAINSGFA